MATRKEIHDEIAAAHERDKLATEIYDTGYNEGKNSNNAAWQQNMAPFADAQKRAAAQLGEQLDAANLTGAGSAAIDRVRKYRQSTPGQTANMGQSNPTVRAAAQEAASNKPMVSEDIMNEILNRKPFSYNAAADALYQQYKDQYLTAGNIAMKDTMGKAAALTGGYGNTYAQTVGQQVYDDYAARAADKIPELYQLALDRYNQEGQDILNKYELLYGRESDADERAYRDRVLERQMFESDREYNFNVEKFGKEYALEVRAQDLAEKVANHEMSMDELRFVLDEKVANHEMSMDDARLIMEKAESEAKIDQIRADIDLGYRSDARADRELTARINNSYYSGSGGGGSPSNSPSNNTTSMTIKTTEDRDAAVAETVQFMLNPAHSADDIDRFVDQWGDWGDTIYSLAEQKIRDKDRAKYYKDDRLK